MPNEIILYILLFLLGEHSFLDPPDWLPAFELDDDLVGVDDLGQIEEYLSLDGVACEVERFVDLDECAGHGIKDIMLIDDEISNQIIWSFLILSNSIAA